MTCEDCLYEPKCLTHIRWGMGTDWNNQYTPDIETRCKSFKNKADLVEVVRCKDCVFSRELDKYEKKLYLDNCVGCCFHSVSYHSLIMEDKDFCNYGKRKEGAEE